MNWESVGILADVISAFAVVASLVYLARQIALSNQLARAEAYRQPNSDLTSIHATLTKGYWIRMRSKTSVATD